MASTLLIMGLTPAQEQFWQEYLASLDPEDRPKGGVMAASPGSPDITDELIDLYLQGKKTAGSGTVENYTTAGDPLPQPGDHWIALDATGRPRCILRTERVEIHSFLDVPDDVARAEGEGDLSLAYWRQAHGSHYLPCLADWGLRRIEDATVVTEFFTLVHR
ncbi:ASCH domain-containing protein [Janibacter melonis]|nr:ASCH domain-containing protein [Janibacter melonis]